MHHICTTEAPEAPLDPCGTSPSRLPGGTKLSSFLATDATPLWTKEEHLGGLALRA